jgi:hypothetical protein
MASSRICVKGLPKSADEARLRAYFGERGQVTDARVMRTPYVFFFFPHIPAAAWKTGARFSSLPPHLRLFHTHPHPQ